MELHEAPPPWPTWKRVGFRALLVYFVIFTLPFPLTCLPVVGAWFDRGHGMFWGAVVELFWATPDVARLLVLVVSTFGISLIWSLVDRKPRSYARAALWLEIGCRFYLGAVMMGYGLVKVFALQMEKPDLAVLVAPLGDLTPMGLLWTFMGLSPAYQSIAGASEVIGGLLLFWRRTRLLGATIIAIVMTNVVMLNFFYDVPVKLNSSHYLLMAIALMLLDGRRLFAVFISNQPAPAADLSPLFSERRAQVAGRVAALGFVCLLLLEEAALILEVNRTYGHALQRHVLWGIHDVESFTRDGDEVPQLADDVRWKALIVDDALPWKFREYQHSGEVFVQRMDGTLHRYEVAFDDAAQTMSLSEDSEVVGVLAFQQTGRVLVLTGELSGSRVDIRLRERDLDGLPLAEGRY